MPFGPSGTPPFFDDPQHRPPAWLQWASGVYGLGVWLHQKLYDWGLRRPVKLLTPVISVGNLTVGGTGKTPITLSLAQWLESKGLHVVILSRGYEAKVKAQSQRADRADYGDEPYTLQQGLQRGTVLVGANRVQSAFAAVESLQPDVIVLDDGFQHRPLARNLDLVLVDGSLGFGNGHLLPAGPLREPVSALKRASGILLTKTPPTDTVLRAVDQALKHTDEKPWMVQAPFGVSGLLNPDSGRKDPAETLSGNPVSLVSALAKPKSFESTVENDLQAVIRQHWVFKDHHNYTSQDIQPIEDALYSDPDLTLLTTTKDWAKLEALMSRFLRSRVRVVLITPQVDWETVIGPCLRNWGVLPCE